MLCTQCKRDVNAQSVRCTLTNAVCHRPVARYSTYITKTSNEQLAIGSAASLRKLSDLIHVLETLITAANHVSCCSALLRFVQAAQCFLHT